MITLLLKTYLKRLTNLSGRNKSLLLSHLAAEQFLDLHDTDFLLSKSSFDLVGQLLAGKNRIPLCDAQDPRFDKVNEVSKRLRKIARTERFIEQERGTRDLYVGYPFVRGKFADGAVVHAPLLFFPVTLRLDREQWCLFGRDDAGLTLNRSFALAYAQFNEVKIPDDILEKSFEDFPKDALAFRTALYEWLKETPFRLNFNQALFENTLQPFEPLKSSDLQEIEKNGELKLYPEMVLGTFPQAGSYLVPDYHVLVKLAEARALDMPLLTGAKDESPAELDETAPPVPMREEDILTPLPTDLSQENVIRLVKGGQSVVVQGPPGTGKSQLICNLMVDFAARGQRVLLVCQKRAALDVVYQRLQSLGFGDFAALIHDFRSDRAALYRQIAAQIDRVDENKALNYSLDAVFLDREFTKDSRLIDQIVGELEAFKSALFDETESGLSVKELYLSSDPAAPQVDLRAWYRSFPLDQTDDFRRRLTSFVTYQQRIGADHGWQERKSFAGYTLGDLRRMEEALAVWPDFYNTQKSEFESLADTQFTTDFINSKKESTERLTDLLELLQNKTTFQLLKKYLDSDFPASERLAFVRQVTDTIEGWQADGAGVEGTLPTHELTAFRAQLAKATLAKASFLKGQWWAWFGESRARIKQVGHANELDTSLEGLQKLDDRLNRRMELEQWKENRLLAFDTADLDGAQPFETSYLAHFQDAERAADAALRVQWKPWQAVILKLANNAPVAKDFLTAVQSLLDWLKKWEVEENKMRSFLTDNQWQGILLESVDHAGKLRQGLHADFDSLVEMDKIAAGFTGAESEVVALLSGKNEAGDGSPKAVVAIFDNSLRLAWIEHIEARYPTLRAVSSLKMAEWETQLQAAIERKQTLSRDIALMQLRERTYRDVEQNRLGNRTTYRELYHQTTKKRNIWPIRRTMAQYSDEVFRLLPCWMASPEAVSTLFPMEAGLFDLVIFDEASQCYAEYGLPAVFRGKQLVVTGDSQQLPPSDLYRVRFEENFDEGESIPAALEVESLLDLAAQSLTQRQLTGHYRSNSLDLIDFSNQHFYKNTLRLLPDFNRVNEAEPGIRYLHVDGVWQNNTNAIEAERVIALVRELAEGALSVGIVTFSFHQQQLIQEMLEKEKIDARDLFVKNIENVQGDERDVIIFSIGYAPDARGRLAMQFGTLNMSGGENRLNVAVTRARQQIYVVTSLWPDQLQTDQTANAGPKLLKAYLQYALDVSEGRYRPQPATNPDYRSARLLKDRISQKDPAYRRELPFADLAYRPEQNYESLLLTDDDLYFGSTSAKEPHAYLPIILKSKNWPFKRVYSREFWRGKVVKNV